MKNYLVTGGAGFIGSHLIDRLLEEGNKVICFDNFDNFYNPVMKWGNVTPHVNNKNFKLVSGNVVDKRSLEKAFQEGKIDAVIHLAAQAGVRPSVQNPGLHFEVNVLGTVNVLEFCNKYNIKKVVFASSSSVYGNHLTVPWTEDLKTDSPLCPYAASKKAGELLCYTYHHLYNIDTACIRPFTVYGSRQRLEMAIPLFTKLIHSRKPLTVNGDGSTLRDYTCVFDVVEGIVRILGRYQGYEIYNLGTSILTSLTTLINEISTRLNVSPIINYSPAGVGEAKLTYADITKAHSHFGYVPEYTIQKGLDHYIEWYLKEVSNAI